jgi:hypothetical protein
MRSSRWQVSIPEIQTTRRLIVLKLLIATTVSLGIVSAAAAADLPRPQPVYPQAAAPVGKMPMGIPIIGKLPIIGKIPVIGKYPAGKTPTAAPVITKG